MGIVFTLLTAVALAGCTNSEPAADSGAGSGTGSDAVYDPGITPDELQTTVDNPFMPLDPGTTWIYEGETEDGFEHIEVVVLPETRQVWGVECTVVRDTVTLDGVLVEDTYDWYAQDADGNVWYMGEEVENYEDGELVDTAGSWEAGVDGALPGVVMWGEPTLGDPYRQEYYAGEAEDFGQVVRLDGEAEVPWGTFTDLLVTREWTPLEAGFAENKYYAAGIGLVLEEIVEGGDGRVELVGFETR